jgi:tetratricopeptide (TPR) repeat protein
VSRWTSLLVVAALGVSTTVHADIWQSAIDRGSADSSRDRYEIALHDGDELAQRANGKNQSMRSVISLIDQALRAYKLAADARPTEGEPYFRIASLIESFFTDCAVMMSSRPVTCPPSMGSKIDIARAKEAVEAWDAFEARSPLDPRVGEALFSRAILRTKLVTGAKDTRIHLEGALKDYTSLLDRADGLTMLRLEQVWGNLAETYMMIGKLDEAIEAYQVSIDQGADTSTYYGKAVALDRDERTTEATDLIRRQGPMGFAEYKEKIRVGLIFYVPAGEEHYYFGLVYEAFGYNSEAVASWKAFIASGAHPQYQARAKAHLDALAKKPLTRPRPTLDPFDVYP